jgi:hypothetical protein
MFSVVSLRNECTSNKFLVTPFMRLHRAKIDISFTDFLLVGSALKASNVALHKSLENSSLAYKGSVAFEDALLATCFMLVSYLAYSSILKLEAICSSETPIDFQWTTWRYIPEDISLHNHRRKTLKSYIISFKLTFQYWSACYAFGHVTPS